MENVKSEAIDFAVSVTLTAVTIIAARAIADKYKNVKENRKAKKLAKNLTVVA